MNFRNSLVLVVAFCSRGAVVSGITTQPILPMPSSEQKYSGTRARDTNLAGNGLCNGGSQTLPLKRGPMSNTSSPVPGQFPKRVRSEPTCGREDGRTPSTAFPAFSRIDIIHDDDSCGRDTRTHSPNDCKLYSQFPFPLVIGVKCRSILAAVT